MTEKRYKMVNTNIVDDDGLVYYLIKKDGRDVCQVFGKYTAKAIVTELNALHEENVKLRARNKCLATKIQRERKSYQKQHEKWENEIQKENEELKQRNNRQAKQLDRLYHLIGEKDWRTLTDILDDFKRCEEQLQKEWGTYGDVE